jgi:hypothetical protein
MTNIPRMATWLALAMLGTITILLAIISWQLQHANHELKGIDTELSSLESRSASQSDDMQRIRAEVIAIRSATPCAVDPGTPLAERLGKRRPGC